MPLRWSFIILLAAGMDDVIVKPFNPQSLYATLERWIGRAGG